DRVALAAAAVDLRLGGDADRLTRAGLLDGTSATGGQGHHRHEPKRPCNAPHMHPPIGSAAARREATRKTSAMRRERVRPAKVLQSGGVVAPPGASCQACA